ncbi:hypothetical protein E3T61_07765 [Cryobacterium lactosi]|uniref:DUF2029 domain-containing protein n=1 Tax=Cryobacterium lactosi TaxID=1259202 RepID=A0A4V3IXQ9_9MICO|nr:hypothetical protein [Cryobacterium lactosi]TFD91863.1 hypothetical protein E3T61_07765 [Cryobacterium lactosi]
MADISFWDFRGTLTGVVYVPAAGLSSILGPQSAQFSILLQNALVLGWFAAFMVPQFVSYWKPLTPQLRWTAALLVWIVTVGFAPYALVDLYPVIGFVCALYLLRSDRLLLILFAGILSGFALNLRPAFLVAAVLVALVSVVWKRWKGVFYALGVVIGLLPQLVVNVSLSGVWTLWPPLQSSLVALQAGYASYIVRYDTLLGAAVPQQFYCSPAMASQLFGTTLPTSTGQLSATFLGNMPNSVIFSLQKIASSLQWPLSTPYSIPAPGLDELFSLTMTAITVIGLLALLRLAITSRGKWTSTVWQNWAGLGVVILSAIVTLVGAATESRFALQLVLIGVVGCLTLPMVSVRQAWARGRWWIVAAVILVMVVTFFGYKGLSHPAAPGDATQATCAVLLDAR